LPTKSRNPCSSIKQYCCLVPVRWVKQRWHERYIKRSSLFQKLLSALALQLGNKVSYTELARLVGADKNTPLSARTDTGALWENYLMAERLKTFRYTNLYGGRYFWRTTQQQEIDYLEDRDGQLRGYDFNRVAGAMECFGQSPFPQTVSGRLSR
jgi:predicted AAA+ superfamily ATPase